MVRRNRRGMILYLVSIIVVMVGLFLAILHHSGMTNKEQVFSKREKIQAQFLARGAQQHFLLKIRFLAAQMYEAAGFSVGRNPYFDFGAYLTGFDGTKVYPVDNLSVGPLFFTGNNTSVQLVDPVGDALAPTGSKIMVVDRAGETSDPATGGLYTGPNFGSSYVSGCTNKEVMSFPLEHFLVDISTTYPPSAPIVRFDSQGSYSSKASMGSEQPVDVAWRDPFTGNYFVEDFRILGQGGGGSRQGKKYEADSVLVMSEAWVRVSGQVSPVTAIGGQPRVLDTLSPALQGKMVSKQGGSGWAELEFSMESKADFDARAGASARRTEIVTATYFIRRPQ